MQYSPDQSQAFTRARSGSGAKANAAALLTVVGCLVALLYGAPAQAQATRTWVSGVGDDANPCSRTAPCKTFAGAISKTAASGEINCLDPGGFGAVTITKALTISCEMGTAGVLVSGTNGIVVQAGVSDHITLRGLDIDGLGTGINGIRFLAGQALIVDRCVIYGFTVNGIDIATGAAGSVTVKDTVINNIGNDGIRVGPGPSLAADHVTISRVNGNGVEMAAANIGTVSNSLIFGTNGGAVASVAGAILNVDNTRLIANNNGANASVAGATIALNNASLYANNAAVATVVGANFVSGQNNKLSDNASNGPPPSANMTTE
jgi:hypothetical protein